MKSFVVTADIKHRFVAKIKKTSKCWMWLASLDKDGYGQFRIGNCIYKAHRIMWLIFIGKIPDKLDVLHKCDNPACVCPSHLFLGTDTDNIDDKMSKHRQKCKLSDYQVVSIRSVWKNRQSTIAELAKMYSVSRYTISAIIGNRSRTKAKN